MAPTHSNADMMFQRWQQLKISKPLVLEELRKQGLSVEEMTHTWENYSRYRLARRNSLGWILMGVGGFLGFVSCVFTILDLVPGFRGFFMYGLTSMAITVALYGCYLVMEKPNDEEA